MGVNKRSARHVALAAAPFLGAGAFYMSGTDYNLAVFNAGILLVLAMMALADTMWERAYALPVLAVVVTIGLVISPARHVAEYVRRPEYAPHEGWVASVLMYAIVAILVWLFVEVVSWFRHRGDNSPGDAQETSSAAKTTRRTRKASMTALPVGVDQGTGKKYLIPAGAGRNALFVGGMGSGKSNAFWAYIFAMLEQHQGALVLYGIDPKGGMELRFAERIFEKLLWNKPGQREGGTSFGEEVADFFDGIAAEVEAKSEQYGNARIRKHEPTPDDPFRLIVIDELLAITQYLPSEYRDRIDSAMGIIATQGRAVGYGMIGATQDGTIGALGTIARHFNIRVCFRVQGHTMVDAVLGPGVRTEYNADAHHISEDEPGVSYVFDPAAKCAYRVKWNYFPDDLLEEFEDRYAAKRLRGDDFPDTAPLPVINVGDISDVVEVGYEEEVPDAPVPLPARIAQVWPEKRKKGRGLVLVSDVAALVDRPEDELRVLLAAEGIAPVSEVSKPLSDPSGKAARGCYQWSDFVGYGVTDPVTARSGA